MKKILTLVLVIVMGLGLCSCSMTDIPTFNNFIKTINKETIEYDEVLDDNAKIRIGVLEPLTGQYASSAEDEVTGIKLARTFYTSVLDKTIELVYADNQSDTTVAVEAAQSLIDSGCRIIIGSYGNLLSLAVCDTIEEAQVPMIIPSCSNPLLTTTTDYCFRVCVVDAFQGNSAARYVIEHLPGVLHPVEKEDSDTEDADGEATGSTGSTDSTDSAEAPARVSCFILKESGDEKASAQIERFQAAMEAEYGSDGYVRVVEYSEGTTDFSSYLEKLSNLGAEAVFFPSTAADAEPVLYQANGLGYKFRWIGNSDWSSLLEESLASQRSDNYYLNNVSYVADHDSETEAENSIAVVYANTVSSYLRIENPGENVALGYDAYLIAIEGLKRAGADATGEELRDAINEISKMDAATGSITYKDGTGDPVKDLVIEKIFNGNVSADYVVMSAVDEE